MRDPKRINRILNKLGQLWQYFPDQCLEQLLANFVFSFATSKKSKVKIGCVPVWLLEDDVMEDQIDVVLNELSLQYPLEQ